jgi:hypothetical protein
MYGALTFLRCGRSHGSASWSNACLLLLQKRGAVYVLAGSQALQPSFTPRRSGARDESASHMTVRLCACARAMDSGRRDVLRDVTANPKQGCRDQHSVSHEQCTGISNKQVCGQAIDSSSRCTRNPLLWPLQ